MNSSPELVWNYVAQYGMPIWENFKLHDEVYVQKVYYACTYVYYLSSYLCFGFAFTLRISLIITIYAFA